MTYPALPDFTVSAPDVQFLPAWFQYTREDGSINVCESTGAAIVRRIRAALGLSPSSVWDSDLQNALIARASLFNSSQPGVGWQSLVNDLNSGLVSRVVTRLAMQFGIWIGYYQNNGLRLDSIYIPDGAVLPQFDSPIPDGSDAFVCFDVNRDQPPETLSQSDFQIAEQQSSAGIRLHPGESLPAPAPPIPPGPSGLSTGMIVGIAVAATAVVIAFAWANRSFAQEEETRKFSSRSRRNPRSIRIRTRRDRSRWNR